MKNLIRYAYLGLFTLVLSVFFVGCGDDEGDDFGPKIVAMPDGIINGTITDLVTQEGIAGVEIVLAIKKSVTPDKTILEDVASTTSDANGNFIFEALRVGDYTLRVIAVGYLNQKATVKVARKEPATVNLRLEPGVRFRGEVISNDGNPVRNVLITLGNRASVTNSGGQFEIAPVSKGLYDLTAEKPGYDTIRMSGIAVGDREVVQKISIQRIMTGQIVFARGDVDGEDFFGISVINANRTGETPLTHFFDLQPTWSPNGREIIFSRSENSGPLQIYIMDSRGRNARSISGDNFNDRHSAWSPDGHRIAFVHTKALGEPAIYTMNVDGENRVRLSNCHAESRPTWSPDGTQIAYSHKGDLYVVDIEAFLAAKEATPPKVEPEPEPEPEVEPKPEPTPEPQPEPETKPHETLHTDQRQYQPPQAPVANPLGIEAGVQRLTSSSNNELHPDWSPDGSKLVFTKEISPSRAAVYIFDLFSLLQTRLTDEDSYNGYPCWSADGTKVAFSSDHNGSFGIWVMDADGSNITLLFDELGQDDILSQHAWRQ